MDTNWNLNTHTHKQNNQFKRANLLQLAGSKASGHVNAQAALGTGKGSDSGNSHSEPLSHELCRAFSSCPGIVPQDLPVASCWQASFLFNFIVFVCAQAFLNSIIVAYCHFVHVVWVLTGRSLASGILVELTRPLGFARLSLCEKQKHMHQWPLQSNASSANKPDASNTNILSQFVNAFAKLLCREKRENRMMIVHEHDQACQFVREKSAECLWIVTSETRSMGLFAMTTTPTKRSPSSSYLSLQILCSCCCWVRLAELLSWPTRNAIASPKWCQWRGNMRSRAQYNRLRLMPIRWRSGNAISSSSSLASLLFNPFDCSLVYALTIFSCLKRNPSNRHATNGLATKSWNRFGSSDGSMLSVCSHDGRSWMNVARPWALVASAIFPLAKKLILFPDNWTHVATFYG